MEDHNVGNNGGGEQAGAGPPNVNVPAPVVAAAAGDGGAGAAGQQQQGQPGVAVPDGQPLAVLWQQFMQMFQQMPPGNGIHDHQHTHVSRRTSDEAVRTFLNQAPEAPKTGEPLSLGLYLANLEKLALAQGFSPGTESEAPLLQAAMNRLAQSPAWQHLVSGLLSDFQPKASYGEPGYARENHGNPLGNWEHFRFQVNARINGPYNSTAAKARAHFFTRAQGLESVPNGGFLLERPMKFISALTTLAQLAKDAGVDNEALKRQILRGLHPQLLISLGGMRSLPDLTVSQIGQMAESAYDLMEIHLNADEARRYKETQRVKGLEALGLSAGTGNPLLQPLGMPASQPAPTPMPVTPGLLQMPAAPVAAGAYSASTQSLSMDMLGSIVTPMPALPLEPSAELLSRVVPVIESLKGKVDALAVNTVSKLESLTEQQLTTANAVNALTPDKSRVVPRNDGTYACKDCKAPDHVAGHYSCPLYSSKKAWPKRDREPGGQGGNGMFSKCQVCLLAGHRTRECTLPMDAEPRCQRAECRGRNFHHKTLCWRTYPELRVKFNEEQAAKRQRSGGGNGHYGPGGGR